MRGLLIQTIEVILRVTYPYPTPHNPPIILIEKKTQ
jgi:hypothetical protein